MSSIFVHVGQCGNQIGAPMWKNFLASDTNRPIFQTLDGFQRSIHIDSEPKVVKVIKKTCKIRDRNIVFGKRGRGTNFALGYHGVASTGDDHILEQSLEAIRKEIERCDTYSGALVFHSLSGGTGSGLGAHIIECLRDDYPCAQIMSCAIAPCVSGESPLQSYNALLTLHWLQSYADAVLFLQNDLLIERAKRPHCDDSAERTQISFNDINKLAASNISGLLLPTDTLSTSGGVKLGQEPWEMVRTLASMPMTKFLTVAHHSSAKSSWSGMASKVFHQVPKYDSEGRLTKSLCATAVARGDSGGSFISEFKQGLENKMRRGLNCVDWNPYPLDCWIAKSNSSKTKDSHSLSLAVNSSCVVDHFSLILERAYAKLSVGAYMQWYQRYGMNKDVFEESMDTLQDIISQYRTAME